jgi:hypothetical protein
MLHAPLHQGLVNLRLGERGTSSELHLFAPLPTARSQVQQFFPALGLWTLPDRSFRRQAIALLTYRNKVPAATTGLTAIGSNRPILIKSIV